MNPSLLKNFHIQSPKKFQEEQIGDLLCTPQVLNQDQEKEKKLALIILSHKEKENKLIKIKERFYHLFKHNNTLPIIDMGVLKYQQQNLKALPIQEILKHLYEKNILPVFLSDTSELVPMIAKFESTFHAYGQTCLMDSLMDIGQNKENNLHYILKAFSYLKKEKQIKILLGYQKYFTPASFLKSLDQMGVLSVRYGEIMENIGFTEPYLRNVNLFSFNIDCLKSFLSNDASIYPPDGLSILEASHIFRYVGLGNSLGSVVIHGFDSNHAISVFESRILGQFLWYLFHAFHNRIEEYPKEDDINFIHFHTYLHPRKDDILFLKSKLTDRWWVRNPNLDSIWGEWIPCLYEDYLHVKEGKSFSLITWKNFDY